MDTLIKDIRKLQKENLLNKIQSKVDKESEDSPILTAIRDINNISTQEEVDIEKYITLIDKYIHKSNYNDGIINIWNEINWKLYNIDKDFIDNIQKQLCTNFQQPQLYSIHHILMNAEAICTHLERINIPKPLRLLIRNQQLAYKSLAIFIPKLILTKMNTKIFTYAIDGYFCSLSPKLEEKRYSRLIVQKDALPFTFHETEDKMPNLVLIASYIIPTGLSISSDLFFFDDEYNLYTTLESDNANVKQKFIMDKFEVFQIPKQFVKSSIVRSLNADISKIAKI